jgi:hypothetical protein
MPSKKYMLAVRSRMATFDSLPPAGRELANDYGLTPAMAAYVSAGQDWSRARADLASDRGKPPMRKRRRWEN